MIFDSNFINSLPRATNLDNPHVVALCKHKELSNLRNQIEGWFANVPDEDKPDLKARLRSKDNGQHIGAFYELLLHQFCLEEGWHTELHFSTDSGLKPDLHIITKENQEFFLEVATQLDEVEFLAANKTKRALDNAITHIATPYTLSLNYWSMPSRDLNIKPIVKVIEKWLGDLTDNGKINRLDLSKNGVELTVDAKVEDLKLKNGCVQAITGPGMIGIPGVDKLKNTLAKKRRKYSSSKTNLPLVVAICDGTDHFMSDETVIDRALYGYPTISFTNNVSDDKPRVGRDNSGYLTPRNTLMAEPQNKGISAVIYVSRIQHEPGEFLYKMLVFHNPWAYIPLPKEVFHWLPQLAVIQNDSKGVKLEWTIKEHEHQRVKFE